MSYLTSPLIERSRRAPQLSREAERELLRRWQQEQDRAAAEQLAEANLRCVVAVAFKFSRYGVPLETLIAEGNMGLVRAMAKYDLEQNVKFSTYATYWIRSFVIDYVLRGWSLVGGGSGALKTRTFFRLRREASRAWSLCGDGEEANEEIAERMHLPVDTVRKLKRQVEGRDVSLNAPAYADSSATLLDLLPSTTADGAEWVERQQVVDMVRPSLTKALGQLNKRERFIVENRLMADSGDALPLSEIAAVFGVSRERVRQIELRAKEKLRLSISSEIDTRDLIAA